MQRNWARTRKSRQWKSRDKQATPIPIMARSESFRPIFQCCTRHPPVTARKAYSQQDHPGPWTACRGNRSTPSWRPQSFRRIGCKDLGHLEPLDQSPRSAPGRSYAGQTIGIAFVLRRRNSPAGRGSFSISCNKRPTAQTPGSCRREPGVIHVAHEYGLRHDRAASARPRESHGHAARSVR